MDDDRSLECHLLDKKLTPEFLAERPGPADIKVTYLEGHTAISLANAIFGFNGWSCSIIDITPDFIEQTKQKKFKVGITAVVRISHKNKDSITNFHEDVGYGVAEDPNKGKALEKAKKEAVTDARKRALKPFGNALGNRITEKPEGSPAPSGSKLDAIKYDNFRSEKNINNAYLTSAQEPNPSIQDTNQSESSTNSQNNFDICFDDTFFSAVDFDFENLDSDSLESPTKRQKIE